MIFGLMAGKSNKIIAYELGTKESTVAVRLSRLYAGLRVNGRKGLADWGRANRDMMGMTGPTDCDKIIALIQQTRLTGAERARIMVEILK